MIRTLRRVSGILPLSRWLTNATTVVVIVVALSILVTGVDDAVHVSITFAIHFVVHAEARPAACTATLTLVVSRKRIPAGKSAATFEAGMWPFTGVQFRVAFQIVQTAETCLAGRTFVWLFLTMCQKMAFEVVMAREVGGAVWTFVTLRGR
jgi:hypothetical protein